MNVLKLSDFSEKIQKGFVESEEINVNEVRRIINENFEKSLISEELFCDSMDIIDSFEKARKKAEIGEIRNFGGRDYVKTTNGWKYKRKDSKKTTSSKKETKKDTTSSKKESLSSSWQELKEVREARKDKSLTNRELIDLGERQRTLEDKVSTEMKSKLKSLGFDNTKSKSVLEKTIPNPSNPDKNYTIVSNFPHDSLELEIYETSKSGKDFKKLISTDFKSAENIDKVVNDLKGGRSLMESLSDSSRGTSVKNAKDILDSKSFDLSSDQKKLVTHLNESLKSFMGTNETNVTQKDIEDKMGWDSNKAHDIIGALTSKGVLKEKTISSMDGNDYKLYHFANQEDMEYQKLASEDKSEVKMPTEKKDKLNVQLEGLEAERSKIRKDTSMPKFIKDKALKWITSEIDEVMKEIDSI